MGLVVQHNITALNANRQLSVTAGQQAKATEKLSSGYRINRAGDDAAGLTISEKMRSQIRGLDKASTNAQDGISLIQSAEGALNEAHSILQRMNELAVQGANDTNQEIDRDAINKELEALTDELDRIAKTTQFNKQELLDGSFQNKKLQVGANAGQNIEISIAAMNADALGLGKVDEVVLSTMTTSNQEITGIEYNKTTFSYDTTATLSANQAAVLTSVKDQISAKFTAGNDLKLGEHYVQTVVSTTGSVVFTPLDKDGAKLSGFATLGSAYERFMSYQVETASDDIMLSMPTYMNIKSWEVDTKVSAKTGNKVYGARVDDYDTANQTIDKVQEAINRVSEQRSALGALQNRLEHTVANLDTVSENTSAAESRIRDTDMAKTMVEYSKNNILAQAGQSMLAQANQSTQGVLSLLQ